MTEPSGQRSSHDSCDLLIIDEMLPCDFSPFRTLEYSHYLSFFERSLLVTTEGWHSFSNLGFDELLAASTLADEVKAKIKVFSEIERISPALAYITFLHNAYQVFPVLQERQIPFVLQLYPGGSFELFSEQSDARLRALCASSLCRKVITTQVISQQYLLETIGCPPEKVEFIYGGVYETRQSFDFSRDKTLFGRDKQTIDICFVAHRYGDDVKKKGYDQFVAVARAFAASHPHMRFHVVGDYLPDQLPLGDAADRVTFHGRQPNAFFETFYPTMDLILSVNRPASGLHGAFDGFPTGACMEAGFRGVLNCISDPLGLNVAFTDGEDVLIVDENSERTIDRIREVVSSPDRLYAMAYANWVRFHEVFDTDRQLWARTEVITTQLLACTPSVTRPPIAAGSDGGQIAHLIQINARLSAILNETQRRHDNLRQEYDRLAAGFEELQGVIAAKDVEVGAQAVPASSPVLEQSSLWKGLWARALALGFKR